MADKSFLEFVTGQTSTSKHLAGKHDQDRHGIRAGANATPAQIAARKRVANMRQEEAQQRMQARPGGKKRASDDAIVDPQDVKKYSKIQEMDDGHLEVEFAGRAAGALYPSKTRDGGTTYRISRGAHLESKKYASRDEAVQALVSVPGSKNAIGAYKKERTERLRYLRGEKRRLTEALQTATGEKREMYQGALDYTNRAIRSWR